MSYGIRKTALGMLALSMMGLAWAGGNKGADTTTAPGAGQNANGAASDVTVGSGPNGTGNGSAQGGAVANSGTNGKGMALQRKQARAARHAEVDKARQQAVDSLRAVFAQHEAAEVAGSSEGVNEKVQSEAKAKSAAK